MKITLTGIFALTAVTLTLGCGLVSCSAIVSLMGGADNKKSEPVIPETVLELADGVLSLIGMVFESLDDPADGPEGGYPEGMTVSWDAVSYSAVISFSDFSPPDDTEGILVNGQSVLKRTQETPLKITISGTLNITGYEYSSVALNGSALWAADKGPPEDEPESISGTFTVDGSQYSLAEIIEAIESKANDGDEPGGETEPADKPIEATPLPSSFMTPNGNLTQSFTERSRGSNIGSVGGLWADSQILRFSISDDGGRYGLYQVGQEGAAGFINWYTLESVQKLDFLDTEKKKVLYSFTVIAYTGAHLQLQSSTGAETIDYIFSKGCANYCGQVFSGGDPLPIGPDTFYPPVMGAQVELGKIDFINAPGVFVKIDGVEIVSTDENGYFEFINCASHLEGPPIGIGMDLVVRVTYTGYITGMGSRQEGAVSRGATKYDRIMFDRQP